MNPQIEYPWCDHGVGKGLPCIRCRRELTENRLRQLLINGDLASQHERTMHLHDLELFEEMLEQGRRIL